MFSRRKYILSLGKTKATLYQTDLGKKPASKALLETNWTNDSLPQLFAIIKKRVSSPLHLLVSDDFVYVAAISIPSQTENKQTAVKEHARAVIPDNLDRTLWGFKEVLRADNGQTTVMQVVALVENFFQALKASTDKTNITIETVEPVSFALARFLADETKPVLVAYCKETPLLIMAHKGLVIATERVARELTPEDVLAFTAFIKERFSLVPQKIIFCGNTKSIDVSVYQKGNIKPEVQSIDPVMSLARKQDIEGKGQGCNLSLVASSNPSHTNVSQALPSEKQEKQQTDTVQGKPSKSMVIFGIILVIVLTGAIFAGIQTLRPLQTETKKPTSSITLPTPTKATLQSEEKVATPTASVNLSLYPIKILNGSKKSGEATKLEALLIEKGFSVKEVGNADTDNYDATEIRYKDTVPSEFKLTLDKVVKDLYDNFREKNLVRGEETPIVIVIGRNE